MNILSKERINKIAFIWNDSNKWSNYAHVSFYQCTLSTAATVKKNCHTCADLKEGRGSGPIPLKNRATRYAIGILYCYFIRVFFIQ